MIRFQSLGLTPYSEALSLQKKLQHLRGLGEIPDTVLTLEHPKVITRGRRKTEEDFRIAPEALRAAGFEVADAGRGGRLTYHGPGQLVGYFIMALPPRRLSIPRFVERVERAVIATMARFDVKAGKREGCPGVWVENRKIASVGFSISRGVSMHGVAINVNPELRDFDVIVPCGIVDCEMTSLQREVGRGPPLEEVEKLFQKKVAEEFS